jgi:exodeoxyribonuclease VII small subunit
VTAARLDGLERRLGDPRRRVVAVARSLDDLKARARRALVRRAAWERRELKGLATELARHGPRELLAAERARVLRQAERLRRTMERRLHAARTDLERETARLDAFSPLACLERGLRHRPPRRREWGGDPGSRRAGPGRRCPPRVCTRAGARAHRLHGIRVMATKGNTTGGSEPRFEESLTELEGVVRRLEQGRAAARGLLVAFERGMALVKQLSKRLEDIERRVEVLLRQDDGSLLTEPLDPDDEA